MWKNFLLQCHLCQILLQILTELTYQILIILIWKMFRPGFEWEKYFLYHAYIILPSLATLAVKKFVDDLHMNKKRFLAIKFPLTLSENSKLAFVEESCVPMSFQKCSVGYTARHRHQNIAEHKNLIIKRSYIISQLIVLQSSTKIEVIHNQHH